MQLNPLKVKHHIRCHSRFLGILPSKFQSEDSNTLAIAYFSLSSLELLNALNTVFTHTEKLSLIDYIYKHLVETETYAGFRGSLTYLPQTESSIELAATCFALQSLLVLGDDLNRVPIRKVIQTVQECQTTDGGFVNTLVSARTSTTAAAHDLRYCMIAATIVKILLKDTSAITAAINVNALTKFIKSLRNFDGGYGMRAGDESHAGMVFCAVDALTMINDEPLNNENDPLIDFLVHRQIQYNEYNENELLQNEYAAVADNGGFNGRVNKSGDTCYVFWTLASLNLLQSDSLIDKHAAMKFLLNGTQNTFMGGFNKTADNEDELPDPLHSYLGLAALSILGHEQVGKINTQFAIPESSFKHWQTLPLRNL